MTDKSPKKEILINVTPSEVRAALLQNSILQEIYIERTARCDLINNIYKGRVSRVLPGMQATFVDIGLERAAFLHVSDIAKPKHADNETEDMSLPNIRELVHEGEEILVQVVKNPLGKKGARLTTFITLSSRYLVLLTKSHNVGVSTYIEDESEREHLRQFLEELLIEFPYGIIARTAAEGATDDILRTDMKFLQELWVDVQKKCKKGKGKTLIYENLSLPTRVLRDLVTNDVGRIRVDSEEDFNAMKCFSNTFLPKTAPILELYTKHRPIFDLHGIENEIKKALARDIPLKSGGYVIFDQTEAMTTVDVNTGSYVGHRNLEETIYRTNLEATVTIARQLRLRNLGGIIIIDFIDMEKEKHRQKIMQALEKSLTHDHARHQITPMSPLGLVEITRQRTRESLQHILCGNCPNCDGLGFIMTAETVCCEILREIIKQHQQFTFKEILVLAHKNVIELLLDAQSNALAKIAEQTSKQIRLQPEPLYLQDQFDVILM